MKWYADKKIMIAVFLGIVSIQGMEKEGNKNSPKESAPESPQGSALGRSGKGTSKRKSLDLNYLKNELDKITGKQETIEEKFQRAQQLTPRRKEKEYEDILSLPSRNEYAPYKSLIWGERFVKYKKDARSTLENIITYTKLKEHKNYQQELQASVSVFKKYYYDARRAYVQKLGCEKTELPEYDRECEADKDMLPLFMEYLVLKCGS